MTILICAINSRFHPIKRALNVDSLFSSNVHDQTYFHKSVVDTLLQLLTSYPRINLHNFDLIGAKYIYKN